ncbi:MULTISPECIES: hypothetical protein [unclassified Pseudomonas]|uniref:hypothetical protein n=1 Tax=unclassified Pseudomonas TaxID=196821 RepID=UPI0011A26763|nr:MULTISPECIES: hypothetical protein [unclassified Pseudomonas]TWC27597.1 hypothetical protein FBY05_101460 [Pseudomonas sp. SJZ083]TWC54063.1 hypothetical protein FBY01_101256 [Pseudomonas sp. SJZ077]
MTKRLVQKTAKKNIHIHNDISNTANHLKKRIEEMERAGNREGIALDITACLVMLAFTFESRLNFIGEKKVDGWIERDRFPEKLKNIQKALNLAPNYSVRPYSSVKQLQDFRNIIAHGKPSKVEVNEAVDFQPGADYDDFDLKGAWEAFLTTDFMRQCSDDIDKIWNEWLATAEIDLHETLTHGEYSITLMEKAPASVGD